MNADGFVEEVKRDLGNNDLAVFLGAGVSFSSGVPIVSPLLSRVFAAVGIGDSVVPRLTEKDISFELVIETIAKEVSVSRLFDVFKASNPRKIGVRPYI